MSVRGWRGPIFFLPRISKIPHFTAFPYSQTPSFSQLYLILNQYLLFLTFSRTPSYYNYNHKFKCIHSHKLNSLKRHNIQDNIQIKMESEKKTGRISLPQKDLTVGQLAAVLNVLAKEYHTTLPALLRKLDRVSGSLEELDRVYSGDHKFEWSQEEDSLLEKNQSLLVRWKGQQAVEVRKKYLQWKSK